VRQQIRTRREGDNWRPVYSELEARLQKGETPEILLGTVFKAFRRRSREALKLVDDIEDAHLQNLCTRFAVFSRLIPIPLTCDTELEASVLKLSLVDQLALFASFTHQKPFDDLLNRIESR